MRREFRRNGLELRCASAKRGMKGVKDRKAVGEAEDGFLRDDAWDQVHASVTLKQA
jgi:hypothetical protein